MNHYVSIKRKLDLCYIDNFLKETTLQKTTPSVMYTHLCTEHRI